MVRSKRQGKRIVHERILYLGNLENIAVDQHRLLVERIGQLLAHQYYAKSEDEEIEKLAIGFVGKIFSRQSGHSYQGEVVKVSGGQITQGGIERIDMKEFMPVRLREGGSEWLCLQAIEELGLRDYLLSCAGWTTSQVELVVMNLMGRLLYPTSERKTAMWLKDQTVTVEMMSQPQSIHGPGLSAAAVALHEEKEGLEDYLYEQLNELLDFGSSDYLYDLTNTYFEGRMQGSSLAQYGRSKEKRGDCPLVSIGLLTNELGFIRRSHFYSGNVSEPGTLEDVMPFLEQNAGILTDAGIASRENIEKLALQQIPYMCVVREGFAQFKVDFDEATCYEHQATNGQKYKVWLTVRSHEFKVEDKTFTDTLIFVKSEAKQAKEDAMVTKQKHRVEKGLEQIKSSLSKSRGRKKVAQIQQRIGKLKAANSRVSKAFSIQTQDDGERVTHLDWTYDASHELRNGTYIIRTSKEIQDAHQAWTTYHTLTKIEAINRCCKTDLNMRPVYHQKDHTIQAHLFLTLIACTIVTYIRHRLAKKGIHWSWKEIVRIMNTQKVVITQFANDQNELFLLNQWSRPEPKTDKIYQAMEYEKVPYKGFFFKIAKPDP